MAQCETGIRDCYSATEGVAIVRYARARTDDVRSRLDAFHLDTRAHRTYSEISTYPLLLPVLAELDIEVRSVTNNLGRAK